METINGYTFCQQNMDTYYLVIKKGLIAMKAV